MGVNIIPGKKYTFAELELIRQQDPVAARKWAMAGYGWRFEMDGTMMLVPSKDLTHGGVAKDRAPREFASSLDDPFNKAELPKIQKRTPQERLDSLLKKVDGDIKAGRAITKTQAQDLTGDKQADTSQAETRRAIAARFLQESEVQHEAKLDKQVTRHED
jgi:hypothetical protein